MAGTVPANTYACLNVVTQGEVRLHDMQRPPLPPVFLTGPYAMPHQTYASAPLQSLSIVLQPWLLTEWFGLSPRELVDGWIDCAQLERLKNSGVKDALRGAVGEPERLPSALQQLACPGTAIGIEAAALSALLADLQSVAAAAAQLGIGVRQFERRFSAMFGLNPRRWLRIKRFESSLVRLARDDASLAGAAADAGYADQPHMTRDFRRTAGHTPAQAKDAIVAPDAPGCWAFKPAGTMPPR